MNLELLNELTLPITVIGCLIVGYVLKSYIPMDSKHIPLIMAIMGVVITVAINGYVDIQVTVIGGALSGLVSTGLHQVFHQYIKNEE